MGLYCKKLPEDMAPLVLIMGADTFLGSHILLQVLKAGYRTKIVADGRQSNKQHLESGVEVSILSGDIATSDLTELFQDTDNLIHIPPPIPFGSDPAEAIQKSLERINNVLSCANRARVPRVIVTSSWVTTTSADELWLVHTDHTYTDQDWNPAKLEDERGDHGLSWFSFAAKTLEERAVWKFAEEYPEIDVTTINPPFIYGPLAEGFKVKKEDAKLLACNLAFYKTVMFRHKLSQKQEACALAIDVRDVARAHALALQAPLSSEVGQKRFLIAGPPFSWKDAVEHLGQRRPELRSRLSDVSGVTRTPIAKVDSSRAQTILGLNYRDWRETVEETVDSLLELEKSWSR